MAMTSTARAATSAPGGRRPGRRRGARPSGLGRGGSPDVRHARPEQPPAEEHERGRQHDQARGTRDHDPDRAGQPEARLSAAGRAAG